MLFSKLCTGQFVHKHQKIYRRALIILTEKFVTIKSGVKKNIEVLPLVCLESHLNP